ncbi:hypothetical protein AB4Z45_27730 [Paenibacillus sp. MCAF9]|uniref:hypothetical protein n=1 Tax=Paenibacillus sp. MCAF9 TaxID=3233046 RepID=UPI003F966A09
MEKHFLSSRPTPSTEYKYFELKGSIGSVIIELYETNKKKVKDKVVEPAEKTVLVEKVDVGDGKGMTRYENQKFSVKNFKEFLILKIGEPYQNESRTAFFEELYYSTPEVVMHEEGEIEVNIPDGPTDGYTVSKRRKEQPALRAMLMRDAPNHHCVLCGNLFPNELLITAHIKKRKHATEDERKKLSIVVPMCKLGCDALFEDGWVGVMDRRVVRIRTEKSTQHLEMAIQNVVEKECRNVNEISAKFYDWHRNYHVHRILLKKS